jgi:hypothetical protein
MRRKQSFIACIVSIIAFSVSAGPAMASGSSGTQAIGQKADSAQRADSDATSSQVAPSNRNISVRVLSPGDDGDVTQMNSSGALSLAGNSNKTSQAAGQLQGTGAGGTQAIGQKASNGQSADADASSRQDHPKNSNIAVRVLSPGDDGSVSQQNRSGAAALAGNANGTRQIALQGGASRRSLLGSLGTQAIGQQAGNGQAAKGESDSSQTSPTNSNGSTATKSPSDKTTRTPGSASRPTSSTSRTPSSGSANGSNSGYSNPGNSGGSKSGNSSGSNSGSGTRSGNGSNAGNSPSSSDSAAASPSTSDSATTSPSTTSGTTSPAGSSERPSAINSGSTGQANGSKSGSAGSNANGTSQGAGQGQTAGNGCIRTRECRGNGAGIQAIGQKADNCQVADADADSRQSGASNTNTPVRVLSPGSGGSVRQYNASGAVALAGNRNATQQLALQGQTGGRGVQAIGQQAGNRQSADADAKSRQQRPKNVNRPVRVLSPGSDGGVGQANVSSALSLAANTNATRQLAGQGIV